MIHDDYLKMLRRHLIEQAKTGERLSYQEFSDKYVLGFEMNDIEQRKELGGLLGQISEYEHSQGRPLLSAMIKHKDDKVPGVGFFSMAERLGRFFPKFMDEDDFAENEFKYVRKYWKNRDPKEE